jgi:hypothetical protein
MDLVGAEFGQRDDISPAPRSVAHLKRGSKGVGVEMFCSRLGL